MPLLGLSNWLDGVLFQDALPELSQADRGFIGTGTHPRVFNPAP